MKRVIGLLAATIIFLINKTVRATHVNAEVMERTPQYILSFWHMHILVMLYSKFRRPITVMSSRSKDGELIVGAYQWYGVKAVRGSSNKGASEALRALLRNAKAGSSIVFTPDGPKGPARIAKDGVIYAAQATGLPIIPLAFAAKRKKLIASWDRMVVPWPFTPAVYVYGEPIVVPRRAEIEPYRLQLEQSMNALVEEAERLVQKSGA